MAVQQVVPGNLGDEFDIGVEEAGKIHVKLDGTMQRNGDGTLGVVAVPSSFYLCQIWAEENGGLNIGQREFSFGNGQNAGTGNPGNWGVVLPWAGDIVALSVGARAGGAGVTTIAVQLNQTDAADITLLANASRAWNPNVSVAFQAGDVLNFRTVAAGGANDVVISAVVRYQI